MDGHGDDDTFAVPVVDTPQRSQVVPRSRLHAARRDSAGNGAPQRYTDTRFGQRTAPQSNAPAVLKATLRG